MLVGHTLPAMVQAIIFLIRLVLVVDPVLLVGCVIAFLMGGLLGVRLVTHARVWVVQTIVGFGLDPCGHLLCHDQSALDARRGN